MDQHTMRPEDARIGAQLPPGMSLHARRVECSACIKSWLVSSTEFSKHRLTPELVAELLAHTSQHLAPRRTLVVIPARHVPHHYYY